MADWIRIRNEYVTGDLGLRTQAAARGVSFNTMKDKAKREGWSRSRAEYRQSLGVAVTAATPPHHTTSATPRATKKESHKEDAPLPEYEPTDTTITRARKVFTAADQLLERIDEMSMRGLDAKEVKLLAAALKDVKEIHMIRDELERQAAELSLRGQQLQNSKLEREIERIESASGGALTVNFQCEGGGE